VNFVDKCSECERISGEYEAATMNWFRLQSQLTITEYSLDEEASDRIVAELSEMARRRQDLRTSAQKHFEDTHPKSISARS